MRNRLAALALTSVALLLQAGLAQAHTTGAEGAGLQHGFLHPLTGLDHLLAMVAVGLWAAQRGGRALWLLPLSFMGMMLAGGAIAFAGLPMGIAEIGIAVSLIVLGLAVAAEYRTGSLVGAVLVGGFAIFHGHAHGAELPEAANPVLYTVGFLAATGLLHGVGIGLFATADRRQGLRKAGSAIIRLAGLAIAGTGFALAAF